MRLKRTVVIISFAVIYAVLLSLSFECLLSLAGMAMAVSIDEDPAIRRLPGFAAFCLAAGCSALLLIVLCVIFNIRKSEELAYTKNAWLVQCALAAVFSIPLIKPWEMLFERLFRIFTI